MKVNIDTHYVDDKFRPEMIVNNQESIAPSKYEGWIDFSRFVEGDYLCPQRIKYENTNEFLITLARLISYAGRNLKQLNHKLNICVLHYDNNITAMAASTYQLRPNF